MGKWVGGQILETLEDKLAECSQEAKRKICVYGEVHLFLENVPEMGRCWVC